MKATELIKQIEKLIAVYGDRVIKVDHNGFYSIDEATAVEQQNWYFVIKS